MGMSSINLRYRLSAQITVLRVEQVLNEFVNWLESYGETSWDHQSFFAGRMGRAAKALYYSHRKLGTAAVAPMVFFEAFLPSARRFFIILQDSRSPTPITRWVSPSFFKSLMTKLIWKARSTF